MRVGLVVDAGCDLPRSFIDENHILILPISIRHRGKTLLANRDDVTIKKFYANGVSKQAYDSQSEPPSIEQIKRFLLNEVVTEFDYVLIETVPQSRSLIFHRATEACHAILNEYKPIRKAAAIDGPFATRVVDSKTLFSGQAVLAAETVRLIREGKSGSAIYKKIDELSRHATALAVVPDLGYLRKRTKKRGDNSVSWVGILLGNLLNIKPILCARNDDTFAVAKVRGFNHAVEAMFDHTINAIHAGLMAPVVCVSYAGDVEAISHMPGFTKLATACHRENIQLLTAPMGLTGAANIGPGAISIGMITDALPFINKG